MRRTTASGDGRLGRRMGRRRGASADLGGRLAPAVTLLVLAVAAHAAVPAGAPAAAHAAAHAAGGQPRPAVPVELVRRGGLPPLEGLLLALDERGVLIDSQRLGERLVPWDRIRAVEGEDDPRLEGWIDEGTRVWRARTRIARGDPLLAEPLFADLFDRMRGRDDEMARTVAEGLLRCLIARGAHDAAVEPLLETLRLEAAGVSTPAFEALPAVIDPEHALAPAVPPAWHEDADAAALAARLDEAVRDLERTAVSEIFSDRQRGAATRAAAVAAAYRHAARAAAGLPPGALPETAGDPGLELLVRCLGGPDAVDAAPEPAEDPDAPIDPETILEAADPVDERPAWVRDWHSYFDGLRRLGADDVLEQDRGLVALLRIPALHAVERPYLAGLALARAAAFLDRAGRDDEAAVLRADLRARFRGHPAIPVGAAGDPESPDP